MCHIAGRLSWFIISLNDANVNSHARKFSGRRVGGLFLLAETNALGVPDDGYPHKVDQENEDEVISPRLLPQATCM